MTDFLVRLLQMSVAGSLVAALLMLWRRILNEAAIHTAFYYMWLLVLLRLCVPFGVTLSLPAPAGYATQAALSSPAQEAAGQEKASDSETAPDASAAAAPSDTPDAAPQEAALSRPDAPREARGASDLLRAPFLWLLVWGVGAVFCLGRYGIGYARFVNAVRKSALPASPQAQGVLWGLHAHGRVGLVECPFVATPMLIGVVRPVIVLPAGITDKGRLSDILMHELVHARRRDLLYKWFAVAVTSLHWFNPVMILVRREIGRACELSCDDALMRGMDAAGRRHYGETLLELAAAAPAGLGLLATTLCEEKRQLKERLVSIAGYRKRGAGAALVCAYVAVFLGGCAMVSGADMSGQSGQKEAMRDGPGAPGVEVSYDSGAEVSDGEAGASPADAPQDDPDGGAAARGQKVREMLRKAMCGESPILCTNGGNAPVPVEIDQVASLFEPDSEYAKIWQFAVIDLDGDGEEEAVLRVLGSTGDMGGCLVLHCADEDVLGFTTSYQSFEVLKTDGTFNARGGGILDGVCKMRFAGSLCSFDWLISCTLPDAQGQAGAASGEPELDYFVDGAPVTEEQWSAALNAQDEKEDARWYFYSREMAETWLAADGGFSLAYTPDDAGQENGGTEAPEEKKDLAGLYRFPVRVSNTRVLTVALETAEPEKTYFSVERICVYDGKTLIQTIETAKLTPSEDYLWEGLFVNEGHAEGEPDVRDVNFDGAEDFGLLCASTYPKNLPFTYFYWNEAEGKFVQGLTIFGGGALEVDYEQKCLIEHWYDVDGEHTTRYA